MTIHFSIQYGKTSLFNAGTREITMKWKENCLPLKGCQLDVLSLIKDDIRPCELFTYKDRTRNVFEFIECTTGWRISDVRIGCCSEDTPQYTFFVTSAE